MFHLFATPGAKTALQTFSAPEHAAEWARRNLSGAWVVKDAHGRVVASATREQPIL